MVPPQPPLPPKPRFIQPQNKINVCLLCGHKGITKRLIYCIQCKACAQHSYCLEKILRDDDGRIIWRCEDCAPNNPKCKPEPSRKSERISYATEAKYKRMIMKKKHSAVRKQLLVGSNEGESVGRLAKNDTEKILPTLENENVPCKQSEPPKVKGPSNMSSGKQAMECENENVLCKQPEPPKVKDPSNMSSGKQAMECEDENVLCKQPEPPKVKDPSNISSGKQAMECEIYSESEVLSTAPQFLHYPESDNYSRARPLSDPIWTGQFRLNNGSHFHLVAYLSSKASPKVNSAVTELPELLDVEMLSRRVIWPQTFDVNPPNSDYIALYFLPQYERDEMIFDRVLKEAIEQDNALKAVTDNLNIFIFSSHLLPPDDRRICKKYYLWSVFKPKPRK